jgi:hypothetical protein
MFGRFLLEPQGGEGGGSTTTEVKADDAKAGDKGADLVKAVEGLISRHGDPTAALRVLMGENYASRDRIRELTARLPAGSSLVLDGDDVKHWNTYKQLGTPGDLKKSLDAGQQFEAEAGGFRKAELVRSAAEVHGFKPSVLGTLARDLDIEIAEAKGKDGKPVRVAVVRGEGDSKTPLTEYAEAHWADFLPSLRADPAARPVGTPTLQRPRTVPAGSGTAAKRRPTTSF